MQGVPTKSVCARRTRKGVGALLMCAALLAPAAAQAADPVGVFGCRASALKAPLIGEPKVANPSYVPCRDDNQSLTGKVEIPNVLVAYGLQATTEDGAINPDGSPTAGGSAAASVAYAAINVLNLVKLQIYGVSSTAGRKCLNPLQPPDIGGSSAIAHITLNGKALPVSIPLRIPLIIGTLYTNYGIKTGSEVLTRAVWLDLAGDANDIILAEARGGATGPLCGIRAPAP